MSSVWQSTDTSEAQVLADQFSFQLLLIDCQNVATSQSRLTKMFNVLFLALTLLIGVMKSQSKHKLKYYAC